MNAVLMDNAIIGDECVIGALAFVPAEMEIPARKVVVGNPAKVVKNVSDEMLEWKTEGTKIYQRLATEMLENLKEAEPLREIPDDRPEIDLDYKTWNEIK